MTVAVAFPWFLTACLDDSPGDSLGEESQAIHVEDSSLGMLVAGKAHACVLMRDGTARCWGAGTDGQLGDGAGVDRISPVTPALPARALALAAGDYHTCAVLVTGQVACWGDGTAGQTGATGDLLAPAIVPGLGTVTALGAGGLHTCAIHATGRASCWGANDRGQLGDGTVLSSVTPRPVRLAGGAPLAEVSNLYAGGDRTCATAGAIPYCWGDNTPDQNGPDAPAPYYVSATFINGWAPSLATTGDTTCRVRSHWGGNYDCVGTFQVPLTSVTTDVVQIDASDRFLCYAEERGRVYCRGANDRGQLATGNTNPMSGAVLLPLSMVLTTAVGDDFACALLAGGGVRCWGRGDRGQIGDGNASTLDRLTVTPVAGELAGGIFDIDAGGAGIGTHACALLGNGVVRCAGHNTSGQLGNGTTSPMTMTPVTASGLSDIIALSTGTSHSCAVRANRYAYCWGANGSGQVGDATNTQRTVPTMVAGIGWTDIAAGQNFTCGVGDDTTWCWGTNNSGQLGVPPSQLSGSLWPIRNQALEALINKSVSVEAGTAHVCALARTGALFCWGRNTYGQSNGNGTTGSYRLPGLAHQDVRDMALGQNHTCIVLVDGRVRCVGRNAAGQLGDGTQIDRAAWVTPKIDGVIAIATGSDHTCALRYDGTARCWGGNSYGQLGVGDNTFRTSPITVALGTARLTAIAGGDVGTCGLRTDNQVVCWGQVGQGLNPPALYTNVPTVLAGF